MYRKFLRCEKCSNLIEMIQDSGINPYCCDQEMVELKPNNQEAAFEKHIPVVTKNENLLTIKVGEIPHPMTAEHYIEWIYLVTNKRTQKVFLTPNDLPQAEFIIQNDEKIICVYAYCNLHSLWIKDYQE